MTKRERELFSALKRIRDALWDHGGMHSEVVGSRLNRAYIAADSLVAKVERERAANQK